MSTSNLHISPVRPALAAGTAVRNATQSSGADFASPDLMRRAPVLLGLVAAGVLVAVAIVALSLGRRADVEVTTAAVTTGVIARQVLATGTLEPVRMVNVGTQVSGTIQSLDADFHTPVLDGAVVARLDPAPYEARIEQARAELARAEARKAELSALLGDATTKLERAQELSGRDLIPRQELDAARVTHQTITADLQASEAEILAAQAALKRAEVDLSHTVIRTPIGGVVVNRHVSVGQTVAAAMESPVLLTIADLRQMHLVAEIDEGEVGGVRPGVPVSFQVESLGQITFEGRIADVRLQPYTQPVASSGTARPEPAATAPTSGSRSTPNAGATGTGGAAGSSSSAEAPSVVSYKAIIEVDNTEGRLMPGGTAIVQLTSSQRAAAVRVPNAALAFAPPADVLAALGQEETTSVHADPERASTRDGARRHGRVWRYDDGRLVPVAIEIGVSDAQWTELLTGPVAPGDELVTRAVVR